jgi:hypothetical protein
VGDRQAVQDTEGPTASRLLVGARRISHGALRHQRHDRIDLGIDALDARQVGSHDLAGGDVLPLDACRQVDRAHLAQRIIFAGRRRTARGKLCRRCARRQRVQGAGGRRCANRLAKGSARDRRRVGPSPFV